MQFYLSCCNWNERMNRNKNRDVSKALEIFCLFVLFELVCWNSFIQKGSQSENIITFMLFILPHPATREKEEKKINNFKSILFWLRKIWNILQQLKRILLGCQKKVCRVCVEIKISTRTARKREKLRQRPLDICHELVSCLSSKINRYFSAQLFHRLPNNYYWKLFAIRRRRLSVYEH